MIGFEIKLRYNSGRLHAHTPAPVATNNNKLLLILLLLLLLWFRLKAFDNKKVSCAVCLMHLRTFNRHCATGNSADTATGNSFDMPLISQKRLWDLS